MGAELATRSLFKAAIKKRTPGPTFAGSTVVTRHKVFALNGGTACRTCHQSARTKDSIRNFIYAECPGTVMERVSLANNNRLRALVERSLASSLAHRSHDIDVCGKFTFCRTCGDSCTVRPRNLLKACGGVTALRQDRGRQLHLRRLLRGLNPLTGELLGLSAVSAE